MDDQQQGQGAAILRARWVFAFNLPCYGGGLRLAPQADGADGMLDLCCFRLGSLRHGIGYALAVYLGWHQRLKTWSMQRVRRVRISSDQPVPYQLDGDPGGYLPLDVQVLPRRLSVLVADG